MLASERDPLSYARFERLLLEISPEFRFFPEIIFDTYSVSLRYQILIIHDKFASICPSILCDFYLSIQIYFVHHVFFFS